MTGANGKIPKTCKIIRMQFVVSVVCQVSSQPAYIKRSSVYAAKLKIIGDECI